MSWIIRPARPDDVGHLYEMAKLTGGGFTNLPPHRSALADKLSQSAAATARPDETLHDDLFVMVLQDTQTGEVRGTCQMFSSIGGKLPFYSYRLVQQTQHSRELDRTFRNQVLQLVTDLEGTSEVGGLFLHPSARAGGLGMLLARSRYLFIAMHRKRFANRLLAELRGVVDAQGNSPFWDGVAGRFFGMTFRDADEFNALHGNQFIADLMPRHPIYVALISADAQAAIGVPHESGRPAMRMLQDEGFAYENYVDIFDGGPTLITQTDSVRTIAAARSDALLNREASAAFGEQALIATGRLGEFRCCVGTRELDHHGIAIDSATRQALNIDAGAETWSVAR
ncbi:arginine N-succinyltransferase [Croceicoccus sp. F390]|uniref:Arginine N-succinyltransferase n=1 Tax=Croceicoccus esteveae TaxID=3075597 RepID=A0ABU2ZJ05_9SPHN|nr:arginine N-succinyltransferase [Croceicoccus sp. F390]MDT0575387.1 arginine N-succinyltransferase [Croceicoccus sp. F390]